MHKAPIYCAMSVYEIIEIIPEPSTTKHLYLLSFPPSPFSHGTVEVSTEN